MPGKYAEVTVPDRAIERVARKAMPEAVAFRIWAGVGILVLGLSVWAALQRYETAGRHADDIAWRMIQMQTAEHELRCPAAKLDAATAEIETARTSKGRPDPGRAKAYLLECRAEAPTLLPKDISFGRLTAEISLWVVLGLIGAVAVAFIGALRRHVSTKQTWTPAMIQLSVGFFAGAAAMLLLAPG